MVKQIHNSVRGRVRYKVIGLYRSTALKYRLEMLLSVQSEISHVSANILTGNVLILYNPDCNVRKIRTDLKQIAIAFVREARADFEALTYAPPKSATRLKDSRRKTERPQLAGPGKHVSKRWHLMDLKLVLGM